MSTVQDVEYTVVLVFPGFGPDREVAERIVENALEHLNIPNYEPGFRFAPNVRAHLEMVSNVDQALSHMEADPDVAMLILHDLYEDEKIGFTVECNERGVPVCHTMETRESPRRKRRPAADKKGGWNFSLRKRENDKPHAHEIPDTTLTEPPEDDEAAYSERVWQVIAVIALGVMEFHWARQPRRFAPLQ